MEASGLVDRVERQLNDALIGLDEAYPEMDFERQVQTDALVWAITSWLQGKQNDVK